MATAAITVGHPLVVLSLHALPIEFAHFRHFRSQNLVQEQISATHVAFQHRCNKHSRKKYLQNVKNVKKRRRNKKRLKTLNRKRWP